MIFSLREEWATRFLGGWTKEERSKHPRKRKKKEKRWD